MKSVGDFGIPVSDSISADISLSALSSEWLLNFSILMFSSGLIGSSSDVFNSFSNASSDVSRAAVFPILLKRLGNVILDGLDEFCQYS